MLDVAHDSDDFAGYVLVFHVYRDFLSEGVLIRKILVDQRLADNHNMGLLSVLLASEQATLLKRDPHGAKVIRFDHADVGAEFVSRRCGTPSIVRLAPDPIPVKGNELPALADSTPGNALIR